MPVPRQGELTLFELWRILVRRRWWILATLLVCVAAGAGWLFANTPAYAANAKVRIGQVANAGLFESTELLSSRLIAEYGEDRADGVRRPKPFLKRAAPSRGAPAVLELTAVGDRPQDAVSLLKRIYGSVHAAHVEFYTQNVKSLSDRIAQASAQRIALQQQYRDASALLNRLIERDPVQASLVALERSRISELMNTLDSELPALEQKLTPPQTQPTELLSEIEAPTRPEGPRPVFVLFLFAFLGCLLGAMLALIIEYLWRQHAGVEAT